VTRLTHSQLAAAQDRGDWTLLWRQVESTVKLVVARMARNNAIRAADVEDMQQEGMLIAGEAVKTWRPFDCALPTHVGNQVRWRLVELAGRERNHGIGSHEQRAAVISLGDTRGEAIENHCGGQDDEEVDDATFDSCLTYEGVLRRNTGQYDGMGFAPEGFGNPSEEADRLLNEENVRLAATALRDSDERDAVVSILLGESTEAYATRRSITTRTVRNWLGSARKKLSLKFPNSRHRKYGSKE
jgi:hypothetical protein